MKKYWSILLITIGLYDCSSSDEPIINAPAVGTPVIVKVGNNGNGADLEVRFKKVDDENLIREYRVFVVPIEDQSTFDVATAGKTAAGNFVVAIPDGTDKVITLTENTRDSNGDIISEPNTYVAFVLSVVSDTNTTGSNTLSSSSSSIKIEKIIIDAPQVGGIIVDDISNNNNGSDLEVIFSKVSDESLIAEYRVFAVKSSNQESFDLTTAENIVESNYLSIAPNGSNQQITFTDNSNDSEGQLISESTEYVVFVLSIADGIHATGINSLSFASDPISLDQSVIKITYIGNDGVHISDGQKSVIIDALPGNLSGWRPLAGGLQAKIERGDPPYESISIAMITHNHGDHFTSTSMRTFLENNQSATLLAPAQIRGGIGVTTGQVSSFNLSLDQQVDLSIDGISVRVMRIRHFTPQNGTDFSSSESLAFLIELGGKKILHIGDGDLSATNFGHLDLVNEHIDVALIPTFTFSGQLKSTNRDILLNKIAPQHIIGLHLASGTTESTVKAIYPDAVVFQKSLEFMRY